MIGIGKGPDGLEACAVLIDERRLTATVEKSGRMELEENGKMYYVSK